MRGMYSTKGSWGERVKGWDKGVKVWGVKGLTGTGVIQEMQQPVKGTLVAKVEGLRGSRKVKVVGFRVTGWDQGTHTHTRGGHSLPDAPVLGCTPAEVWLLGGGGYPLHPAVTAGPHLGGLRGDDVVETHLLVLRPRQELTITTARDKLCVYVCACVLCVCAWCMCSVSACVCVCACVCT